MKNICGEYKIRIWIDDDIYIVKITDNKGNIFHTNGNYNEIFYMIGDCLATIFDIEIPLWKKLIIKIFNLPFLKNYFK